MTNCSVIGNSALQGNGGAIYNDGSNNAHGATAEVFLNNCTFSGNSASGNGGAIASSDDNGGGVAGALISVSRLPLEITRRTQAAVSTTTLSME